ncbi:MAG: J domain-containing protein [Robiginitomaculum sp.]|nr:J domain-containing protein [Robiginitomaculum sp.]
MTRHQAMMTLGLNMSAREADIRTAWRTKAKFYHPDSPYGSVSAFLQCKRAYETLIPPAPQTVRVQARSRAV